MKQIPLFSILSFLGLISCNTEHVLLDNHMGVVLDKSTNTPISGVEIYTNSMAFDYFEPFITKEDGVFYTPGLICPENDKGYRWRRHMSYTLIFKSAGYTSDTIRLQGDNNQQLDTIDLGNIYLVPKT